MISLIAKKSENDSDVILLTNSKKTLGRIYAYRRSFKKDRDLKEIMDYNQKNPAEIFWDDGMKA